MAERTVTIRNMTGLDLAPAGKLCNLAMQFQSSITFSYEGGNANAKSILSILGSAISSGDDITFHCVGTDEEEALAAITALIENGLDD